MLVNSASIDHHKLNVGLHLVNDIVMIPHNNHVYEYDLRFIKPLQEPDVKRLLDVNAIHTIEHFLAYYLRKAHEKMFPNGNPQVGILSLHPYGCRTGFGCLSTVPPSKFITLLYNAIQSSLNNIHTIPFCDTKLCGNCFSNDTEKARQYLEQFHHDLLVQFSNGMDEYLNPPRVNQVEE